jgi:hypothetical protein
MPPSKTQHSMATHSLAAVADLPPIPVIIPQPMVPRPSW